MFTYWQHVCSNVGVCVLVWLLFDCCQCIDLVIAFCVSSLPNLTASSFLWKKHLFRNKIELLFSYNGIIDFKFIFITFKIQPFFRRCFRSVRTFYLLFFLFLFSVTLNWFVCTKKTFTIKNQIEWNEKKTKPRTPKITHNEQQQKSKRDNKILVYHVFSLSIHFDVVLLLFSFITFGILDVCIVYVNTQIHKHKSKRANLTKCKSNTNM